MTDLFLNINQICVVAADQFLMSFSGLFLDGMGLPAIDQALAGLLSQLDGFARHAFKPMTSIAVALAEIFTLIVLSWECIKMIGLNYQWSLGKILRPFGLFFLITNYTFVTEFLDFPTNNNMTGYFQRVANTQGSAVASMEMQVAKLSKEYVDSLNSKITKQAESSSGVQVSDIKYDENGRAIFVTESSSFYDEIKADLNMYAKKSMLYIETKLVEVANKIIRYIGELIWQMMYYGLLIGAKFGWAVLYMFGPIAIAISIAPPFSSAWSTWVARYINITLYPILLYVAVAMVDQMFIYALSRDIATYNNLLNHVNIPGQGESWHDILALGLNNIGTTTAYVGAMLAGSNVIRMIPEVASWIMPAEAAQGLSQMAAGFASSGTRMATGAATTAVTAAGVATAGAVTMAGTVAAPVLGAAKGVAQNIGGQGYSMAKGAVAGAIEHRSDKKKAKKGQGDMPRNTMWQEAKRQASEARQQYVQERVEAQASKEIATRLIQTGAFERQQQAVEKVVGAASLAHTTMSQNFSGIAAKNITSEGSSINMKKELMRESVIAYGGDPTKMSFRQQKKYVAKAQKSGKPILNTKEGQYIDQLNKEVERLQREATGEAQTTLGRIAGTLKEMEEYNKAVNDIIHMKNLTPQQKEWLLFKKDLVGGMKSQYRQNKKVASAVKTATDKVTRGTNWIINKANDLQ